MTDAAGIHEFIERARGGGASEQAIVGMLTARGWSEKQAYEALASDFENVTGMRIPQRGAAGTAAKDAFFHLLIFSTLATWTFGVGMLAFTLIERWLPDPLVVVQGYAASEYRFVVAWSMATMLVAFPIFLLISRTVLRDEERHPEKLQSPVRKWLTYMVLVVAAGIVIGDLISWLTYALRGELTSRVLAKGFVVLVLSGGVFFYYFGGLSRADEAGVRGWSRDRWMAGMSALVVLLMLTLGFTNNGTPRWQRLVRADEKRVHDLLQVSQGISTQWSATQKLPQRLDELRGMGMVDPGTGVAYEYHPHEDSHYELCTTFSLNSDMDELMAKESEWRHPAGRYCYAMDAARAPDGRVPFVVD